MDWYSPPATIADAVAGELIRSIDNGEYLPGQKLNDGELAARFGVSRTPVREALQRLRAQGLIETAASRFTRVATPDERDIRECEVIGAALLRAVVDEVVPGRPDEMVDEAEDCLDRYRRATEGSDGLAVMMGLNDFIHVLMRRSTNRRLVEMLEAAIHLYLLATRASVSPAELSELLTSNVGTSRSLSIVENLCDGIRDADVERCRAAVARIGDPGLP